MNLLIAFLLCCEMNSSAATPTPRKCHIRQRQPTDTAVQKGLQTQSKQLFASTQNHPTDKCIDNSRYDSFALFVEYDSPSMAAIMPFPATYHTAPIYHALKGASMGDGGRSILVVCVCNGVEGLRLQLTVAIIINIAIINCKSRASSIVFTIIGVFCTV